MLKHTTLALAGLSLFVLSADPSRASAIPRGDHTYAATDGPIVLVSGLLSFDQLMDMNGVSADCEGGLFSYWGAAPDELEHRGAIVRCYSPSPLNSNEYRGRELVAYLEELSLEFPGKRFNLLGHSQGGPTARFAAHHRPDLVASVTGIAAANGPSHIGDFLIEHLGETPADVDMSNPLQYLGHHLAILGGNSIGALIDIVESPEDFANLIENEADNVNAYGAIYSLASTEAMRFNAPCAAGEDDWTDGCGISESVPDYLKDYDAGVQCRTTGTVPAGWAASGAHLEQVAVTAGSPGVDPAQVGKVFPVRYWSYGGATPTTSEQFELWVGWPFAEPIISAIESLPEGVQALFPFSRGLASDATFGFFSDPIDYFMGMTALTALQDLSDLDSAPIATDGMLSPCVTHMGDLIRDDYNMNHLDVSDMLGDLDWLLDPDPENGVAPNGSAQVRTDIVDEYTNCYHFFGWRCDEVYLQETEPSSIMRMQANRIREAGL